MNITTYSEELFFLNDQDQTKREKEKNKINKNKKNNLFDSQLTLKAQNWRQQILRLQNIKTRAVIRQHSLPEVVLAHHKHKVLRMWSWPSIKDRLLCRWGGGGGWIWFQHIAMLPVQVKVWKLIQPISGPELPYMIILLADWRCWHYELKRQNDTDCCCVPILLTTFPPNLSGTYL